MDGKKYTDRVILPKTSDLKRYKYARNMLRARVGNQLLDILQDGKLPAVVDIEETSREYPINGWDYRDMGDELIIEFTVTPFEHKYVTLAYNERREGRVKKWLRKLFGG